MSSGGIKRRCRCRENGQELGTKCPKLSHRSHGSWYVQQEMFQIGGKRKFFRRGGHKTHKEAQETLDGVRELLNLAGNNAESGRIITEMLLGVMERKEELPKTDVIRQRMEVKPQSLEEIPAAGDWYDRWLVQRKALVTAKKLRENTYVSNESHVRLYLKPKTGHLRLDRLDYNAIVEMFNKIADESDSIDASNADRRSLTAMRKAADDPTEKKRIRQQLATLPPFRRSVGLSSRARILSTLSKCLNDAKDRKNGRLITYNPAEDYSVGATAPKPALWTDERVEHWRRTGQRPGPVMVWTEKHAGLFLDYVQVYDPDYEAMWNLLVYRGIRRGETAGLSWTETQLDEQLIEITQQLVEIAYAIECEDPKSAAGVRTLPLDDPLTYLLRVHHARQKEWKQAFGSAWVESGKVFTMRDGSALRPSWIRKRFLRLCEAAGLPPVRLHDLRHLAATLMLAAGIDMKVVQVILGHAEMRITSDLYTTVLPKVSRAALEGMADVIPRQRVHTQVLTLEHPSNTPRTDTVDKPVTQESPPPANPQVNGPSAVELNGAPEGIRTPNLLIRSQMLYPLSYGRMFSCRSA
jgi:integrase